MRAVVLGFVIILAGAGLGPGSGAGAQEAVAPHAGRAGAHGEAPAADGLTPEQRMERRFPQRVRVGDLIGLPLLDASDRTLGRVERVVRTADGKVLLLTRHGRWFGIGGTPVSVPIETVAILARQIAVLDIPRPAFFALPEWREGAETAIPPDEIIRIAITRR